MSDERVNLILAADIGSAHTRALLYERVDGVFTLAAHARARTTIDGPAGDARASLTAILGEMGAASGHRFLDEAGSLIQPRRNDSLGVDYFLTTVSAGPPLRAALAGLFPDMSIAALRRAIAPFYVDAVAELHLEDGLGETGRLNRLVHSAPQLIIVAGGWDDGARGSMLELLSLLRRALSLMPPGEKPTLLYAGNSSLRANVHEMLSQQTEVLIAPNILSQAGATVAPMQAVLESHLDGVRRRDNAFQRLAALSDSSLLPSARGIETMTAFFARATGLETLCVDIGSASAMLSLAGKSDTRTLVRSDLGLGSSAPSALDLVGHAAVASWLPFQPREGELEQYARSKADHPASRPLDMRQRSLEGALLRACLRFLRAELDLAADWRPGLLLLCGAALNNGPQGALDMLLVADALSPEGVVQLKADPHGALATLGALSSTHPEAVVQLAHGNALEHVGSLLRVSGSAPAGAAALNVQVTREGGAEITREVKAGDVWRLPAPAGEAVELRIQARRGLSIGGRRRLRQRVYGGRGGILIDARLDAMTRASSVTERATRMLRWFAAVSEQSGPVVIPEDWLAAP